MDAGKKKINDILNGNRQLVIPFFQRSYVWKEDLAAISCASSALRASTSMMTLSPSKVITSIVRYLRALLELREAAAMLITYVMILKVL